METTKGLKIRPTRKQRNLARIVLEHSGDPIEKKDLVALGGYGKGTQQTPAKVLESKGYKAALAEFGLTEGLITTALVSDIESKPKNRVAELRLGAEILGMKENKPNTTINILNISQEKKEAVDKAISDYLDYEDS